MSAAFYNQLAKTAAKLLARRGAPITFSRTTGGSIDPVTGVVVPGTTATFTPVGIIKNFPDALIDGTRIQTSDKIVVSDASFEPAMTDTVSIESQDWSIVKITANAPAGLPLSYTTQVRR